MDSRLSLAAIVRILVEDRGDGGVRIHSPDVPGLHLSGPDREAVARDLCPAIEILFRENRGVEVTAIPLVSLADDEARFVSDDPPLLDPVISAIETGQIVVSRAIP